MTQTRSVERPEHMACVPKAPGSKPKGAVGKAAGTELSVSCLCF